MPYDAELIDDIILDLNDSETDTLVLFILHSHDRPVLKTRMQKEALIYNQTYTRNNGHEAYYFGGYSDDVDESYSALSDMGMISNSNKGMKLTNFGNTVVCRMMSEGTGIVAGERTKLMERSIGLIDDKTLVAITYRLFPELAKESTIEKTIEPIIDRTALNGKPLRKWTAEEFLECIRTGTTINPGRISR